MQIQKKVSIEYLHIIIPCFHEYLWTEFFFLSENFYKFIWAKMMTYAGEQDLKCSPFFLIQLFQYLPKKQRRRAFPRGPGRMAPAEKGDKKNGHSAISEVVTRESTINIQSAFMKWVSRSVPLRHSKRPGNLPWRRWEFQMCAWHQTQQRSGPKE